MESDTEGDLDGKEDFSSKQDFKKIQRDLVSTGFREGASAGKDSTFQAGFDAGYTEGFKAAFSLGRINGVVETARRNAEALSLDLKDLDGCGFENARFGLCQICNADSSKPSCSCNKEDCCKTPENSTLLKRHRETVSRILNEEKSKCAAVFENAKLSSLLLEDEEQG